jgi:hypothetical protein
VPGEAQYLAVSPNNLLEVPIRNAGRGPAIFVRASLDPDGQSPDNWSLGSLGADATARLRFHGAQVGAAHYQVLLDYDDIVGRSYSSAIVIQRLPGELRFYDLQIVEGASITSHGPPTRPQPGLRDISPRRGVKSKLRGLLR